MKNLFTYANVLVYRFVPLTDYYYYFQDLYGKAVILVLRTNEVNVNIMLVSTPHFYSGTPLVYLGIAPSQNT